MGDVLLRPLRPEEFDAAHGILVSAADWLTARGIRQWTTAYPKELYRSHQAKGWNYALLSDGELAAVLTLSYEASTDWTDSVGVEPVWWLSKLATAPAHRGQGLGARAVREACGLLAAKGAGRVHLDCVHGSGALVRFYEGLGFTALDRRVLKFATGEFDMVLMSAAVAARMEDVRNFRRVDDRLATCGQPTEAQLEAARNGGVEVVINLALHDDPRYSLPDERGTVEALGMAYRHIPVQFSQPTESELLAFFDAMDTARDQHVLVHCAANYRVTAFLGLYRRLRQDWPVDRAFELMGGVWTPDKVWSDFIESMLARHGDSGGSSADRE